MDGNDGAAGTTLFANVRSKLISFNASEFLSNLGFIKRKVAPKSDSKQTLQLSPVSGAEKSPEKVAGGQSFMKEDEILVNGKMTRQQDSSPEANKNDPVDSNVNFSQPDMPRDITPIIASSRNSTLSLSPVDHEVTIDKTDFLNNSVCINFYFDNFWNANDREFNYGDTLEKQHFGEVKELLTTGKRELGVGHEFEIAQLVNSTFCDKCGDFIWGLYKQAVRCVHCRYTCHYKCKDLVNLDCRSVTEKAQNGLKTVTAAVDRPGFDAADQSSFLHDDFGLEPAAESLIVESVVESEIIKDDINNIESNNESEKMLKMEISQLIQEYNVNAEGLKMTVDDKDSSYRGFIQIYMNFSRPVSIISGEKPSSMYDVLSAEDTLNGALNERKTITSFFLPRNTVKILHIDSRTTTRELIAALLKKFKVADNPKKFALYERDLEAGKTLIARLRRVADDAYPLHILLKWGSSSTKRFVLQENDTGDILWDYFEVPELENFLKILAREEQQYVTQIRQKFNTYRFYLQTELRERGVAVQYCESPVSTELENSGS